MSKVVDERVVEMRFDNRQFEQNVSTTMSTLDKFKQKLKFEGATKGLEEVGAAAQKVDTRGLGAGIEAVTAKFSALQVMGVTALANITNSAVNAGKRIVSALTIDPVKTGFQEYETQMNAVQTILANTQSKGSTIDDVNKALDELNHYADLTIYNFTEMTRNIGTFTAAGIDLKTSVSAIQGIANLAAVSGSTSQQASTAMYQLSQALAAGTVKLMDWNSVVNAGMGGEIFQNALKKTSELLGTGAEAAIKAKGSFRESLAEGWLTSQVLTETLKKFTTSGANEYVAEYTGLSADAVQAALDSAEAQYGEAEAVNQAAKALAKKSGKNEQEIKDALNMAKTAQDAATKVKTFSQLWDVMKEAAQSGWSKTWQLIIGDFEEAKNLLTPLSDFFTNIIGKMSDARNNLLEGALGKTFSSLSKTLDTVLAPAKKATDTITTVTDAVSDLGSIVDDVILGKFGNGQERFDKLTASGYNWCVVQNKVNEQLGNTYRYTEDQIAAQNKLLGVQKDSTESTSETAKATTELTDEKKNLIKELVSMTEEQAKAKGYTDEQIEAFKELGKAADKLGMPLDEFIDNLDQINGRWLLINSFKNIGQGLVTVFKSIGAAWKEVFPSSVEERSEKLFNVFAGFYKITRKFRDAIEQNSDQIVRTFKGLFAVIDIVATVIGGPIKIAFKLFSQLLGAFNLNIWDVTAAIGDAIVKFRDWIDSTLDFTKVFEKITPYLRVFIDKVKELVNNVKGSSVFKKLSESLGKILDLFKKIKDIDFSNINFKELGAQIRNAISSIFTEMVGVGRNVIDGLTEGLGDGIQKVISTIKKIVTALVETFCGFLGIASPSKLFMSFGVFIIGGLILGILSAKTDVLDVFKNIASTCYTAVKDGFSKVSTSFGEFWPKVVSVLKKGIGAVTNFFKGIDWGSIIAAGFGVAMLALAFKIVDVVKMFATPFTALAGMFDAVGTFIKDLGAGLNKYFKAKAFNEMTAGIKNMAIAVGILAASVYVLSKIDSDDLWRSVGAVAALVGIVAAFAAISAVLSKVGSLGVQSLSLVALAASVLIVAVALKKLSGIDLKTASGAIDLMGDLILGMIALVMAFGVISKHGNTSNMYQAGIMLLGMAIAMKIMVKTVAIAGELDKSVVQKGLGVISLVGLLFMALIAVSKLAGENASKAGNMLIKMSIALLLMVAVIKVASMLDASEVNRGLRVIVSVGLLFTALIAVSKLAGKNASKAGVMLLLMSASLMLVAQFIKQVSDLDESEIKRGLTVMAGVGLLFAALIAISKLAGDNAMKAGVMLLAMSGALLILTGVMYLLSKFDEDGLKRGLAAISILIALMGGLIAVTKLAGKVKVGTLVVLLSAIVVLVVAAIGLSFIDPEKLKNSVTALSTLLVAFALVIAASKLASDSKAIGKNLIIMVGVIALLALIVAGLSLVDSANAILNVAALSMLLIALSAALAILGKSGKLSKDTAGSLLILVGITALLALIVYGLSLIPNPETALSMTGTLITLLLAFTAVTAVLSTIGKTNSVASAAKGAAQLAIVVGIVTAMTVLIGVLMGLINADWMSEIETGLDRFVGIMTKVSGVILAFIPVTAALGLIGKLLGAGAVVSGAAGLVAAIGIIGAVAVAIGSLMSLFTDDFFTQIETGLDRFTSVMVKIGEAIGGFVGGILGGIADGVLAGVGNGLTDFMNNAQGFIDGCRGVDESVLNGAKTLAGAILAISAADLVNSFVDLFDVGPTLPKLGADLSAFMNNAKDFIDASSNLDPSATTGLKSLADAIIVLTGANLIDGISRFFSLGTSSLATFGEQLPILGTGLSGFVTNLGDFSGKKEIIALAADAIKTLAKASAEIPNAGGLLAAIVGDNDLSTWATQLPLVGIGISGFISTLGDFDEGKVETAKYAADVIKTLARASAEIPNTGGLLAAIVGDNDLSTWAAQLPLVGTGISGFITNLGEFDDSKVTVASAAADVIKVLAKASAEIPNTGGWLAAIVGDNDLSTWATQLPLVGTGISGFITNLGDFGEDGIATAKCAANVIKILAEASKSIDGQAGWAKKIFGDNSISTFSDQFGTLGANIKTFVSNLGTFSDAQVTTAQKGISAVKAFATLADSDLSSAKKNLGGFGEQLPQLGSDIKNFCGNLPGSDSIDLAISILKKVMAAIEDVCAFDAGTFDDFVNSMGAIGEKGIKKFVESFTSSTAKTDVKDAIKKLVDSAINAIGDKETDFKDACDTLTDKGVNGIKEQGNYDSFKSAGKYLIDGLVAGINAKKQEVYDAAYALGQKAVQGEKDGQASNSPSKLTMKAGRWLGEGLIIGIQEMSSKVYRSGNELGKKATSSISSAIRNLSSAINTDMDVQPTIRPVVDLDNVKTGANAISDLFGQHQSIGLNANINAVNSMMNRRSQNGNNANIVSAIDKIHKDINGISRPSYSIGGITYDAGSEVAEAIETLVRAAKIERRV